jgi:flagellar biosynthesis protein FliP
VLNIKRQGDRETSRRSAVAERQGEFDTAHSSPCFPLSLFLCLRLLLAVIVVTTLTSSAYAQSAATDVPAASLLPSGIGGPADWTSPQGLASTLQIMLLLTVVSLAPAILLMTTSFVRIIVVLGLLRQALGTQQLPPSQVITSIAMFMTLLLMAPVWKKSYDDGIRPYTNNEISLQEAFTRGTDPIRRFMADQIQRTENDDDVYLFLEYLPSTIDSSTGQELQYVYYDAQPGETEVPLTALLPAFMLSELKTAFLIGFQIYLPFVILDIVVSTVTISMGMLMLPPVLISLPFKLLLFVLVDGWRLVVEMLLRSFQIVV